MEAALEQLSICLRARVVSTAVIVTMKKLLQSMQDDTIQYLEYYVAETPPGSPDSRESEETDEDREEIREPFEIPLPPGKPPAQAIYNSSIMDFSLEELSPLYPTSIIVVNPDTPSICKDYQQGKCRNEDCICAHEVGTAELQRIFARFMNANA